MRSLLALLFASISSMALADRCDQASRSELGIFDRVYCDNQIFVAEDKRLNDNYQELRSLLDADGRQILLDSQRHWLDHRNSECVGNNPRWGEVVYANCAASMTRARANFLENRITDCQTVGCDLGRISDLD